MFLRFIKNQKESGNQEKILLKMMSNNIFFHARPLSAPSKFGASSWVKVPVG